MSSTRSPSLNRDVARLTAQDMAKFGRFEPAPFPDLFDPVLLTFQSRRGMMVCGFEDLDSRRYYQGWWLQWKTGGAGLVCSVVRTHRLGEKLRDSDWGAPVVGSVSMSTVMNKSLNRFVMAMTMTRYGKFGSVENSPIPALYEPELLTFDSERGMMVCGLEEVANCRHYQG